MNEKMFRVFGFEKACSAIPPVGFVQFYRPRSMPYYRPVPELFFVSFADALAYAIRYCSDYPFEIRRFAWFNTEYAQLVFRSACFV